MTPTSSIYKFKYGNAREFAEYYGEIAAKIYAGTFKTWKIDGIIPVPIHRKRELKRGYNQAEIFADIIADKTGLPMLRDGMIRVKDTAPQKELSNEMRRQNLEGAFAVDKEVLTDYKNILIVDDIYTTGSTIDACAKVLKAAGIIKIYFICISTGVI